MQAGTVKFVNRAKGYGFIQPDDASKEPLVHICALEQAGIHSIADAQKVFFDAVAAKPRLSTFNWLKTSLRGCPGKS